MVLEWRSVVLKLRYVVLEFCFLVLELRYMFLELCYVVLELPYMVLDLRYVVFELRYMLLELRYLSLHLKCVMRFRNYIMWLQRPVWLNGWVLGKRLWHWCSNITEKQVSKNQISHTVQLYLISWHCFINFDHHCRI